MRLIIGFAETLIAQSVALGKTPFDLMRGSGGEEKVLKNAKDACATEAFEIATYTALERLATGVGDEQTATLAASIRGDEERMLGRIMREPPPSRAKPRMHRWRCPRRNLQPTANCQLGEWNLQARRQR